jgi:uncharacterized membrane protein
MKRTHAETLALAQGAYWAGTGVWPLVHYRSFEAITGRKREPWLVKTVGALISVVGGTLLYAGWKREVNAPVRLLAWAGAAAMMAVDGWYAGRGRIAPVYLADAALEAGLLVGWAVTREKGPCAALKTDEGHSVGGCFDIQPGETLRPDGTRDDVLESSMQSFPASDAPQRF